MDHQDIVARRPLTESFVLPPYHKGVHQMPHRIENTIAFGPGAPNDLTRAFEAAWLELRTQGIGLNTKDQLEHIRARLAERIVEDAAEGEHDMERLKEYGLQGSLTYVPMGFDCRIAAAREGR